MGIELQTELRELNDSISGPIGAHFELDSVLLGGDLYTRMAADVRAAHALHKLMNTPELVDFAKAVQLEAAHQLDRWGTGDRTGKTPADWHWLVAHLAGRALEHHKEAERLQAEQADWTEGLDAEGKAAVGAHIHSQVAHHREKAVHHTITAAAVLAHWHAAVLTGYTEMQPGSPEAAAAAEKLGAA